MNAASLPRAISKRGVGSRQPTNARAPGRISCILDALKLKAETWRFLSICMLAVHVLVLEACRCATHQRARGLQKLYSSFIFAPQDPHTECSRCEVCVARTRPRPADTVNALLIAYMRRLKILLMRCNPRKGAPIRAWSEGTRRMHALATDRFTQVLNGRTAQLRLHVACERLKPEEWAS